jgi:hypothetical protein
LPARLRFARFAHHQEPAVPTDRPRPGRRGLAAAALALAVVTGAACSSSGGSKTTTTTKSAREKAKEADEAAQKAARTTKWKSYNRKRKGFDATANAAARSLASTLNAGGYACANIADTSFASIATSYVKQGLPLPIGSAQCDGGADGSENILIEVFGAKHPNASDFVAAKRKLICARAKKLGRQPDGTNDFDGIPYVEAGDGTWLIEPDSFTTNDQIASIVGRSSLDMCEGIE